MAALPEIAVSSGAACSTATAKPSHVLKAIGLSDAQIKTSIRFGLGRFNTTEEIDRTIKLIVRAVSLLAGAAPF